MNDDVVIKVEGVSKKYCRSLKHTMMYGATDLARSFLGMNQNTESLRDGEFWALDNINFELKKGETLGIIGANGSGKSTLLKMLNGIFMPDRGKIEINGKVGALIEVGAGFHPMLTGRENIYINGAILGMTKDEIDRKFDEIIDFADIGEFIDSPVKHYSSGMYVRLGFAIAVHCEPDILLVDEVMSVGDIRFQKKCADKILELKNRASTIFVSHSMRHVYRICDKAILLNNSKVDLIDRVETVVTEYVNRNIHRPENSDVITVTESVDSIKSINVALFDKDGKEARTFEFGSKIRIRISFYATEEIKDVLVAIIIFSVDGNVITTFNNEDSVFKLKNGQNTIDSIIEEVHLLPGLYSFTIRIYSKNIDMISEINAGGFEIIHIKNKFMPSLSGYYKEKVVWAFNT